MKKYLLVFLFLLFQCSFPKRLGNYPLETRGLFLYHFINHSHVPSLNPRLGLSLRREIARRRNFDLGEEPQKLRLWLKGEIRSYQKKQRFHIRSQASQQYEILILCRIRLQENPNRIKGREPRLLLSEELGARVYFSEKEGYVEDEAEAQRRLLYILSLRINKALEEAYLKDAYLSKNTRESEIGKDTKN